MIDVFVEYPGKWAVLEGQDKKFIGRVLTVEDELDLNSEIKLQPVFEYMSGLVETENGIGRQVLLNPYDICTTFETPLRFKAGYFSLYVLFEDMDPADKREYEKVVSKGVAIALQARAQKSGISLHSTMPQAQGNNPLIFSK